MNMKWIAFLLIPALLCAKPKKPEVVRGKAAISQQGCTTEVRTSERAIINWEEFSIHSGETTRFVQPSTNSAVLNRIAQGPSHIDGILQANGRVYLLNPNGILIGPNGCIQAAHFMASTLDLDNEDFFKNKDLLFKGSSKAGIVNLGKIEAIGGDVFLLAKAIVNEGTVHAETGVVGIAAGEEILLKPSGMQRLFISPQFQEEKEDSGIVNQGMIEAAHAELRADGNAFRFAINQAGKIEATGMKEENGRIFLVAEKGTSVNSGTMIAKGGKIQILGEQVGINDSGIVDVSSSQKGGEVLLGGDFQGKNPKIPNAQTTVVMENAKIYADAQTEGDGGKVIVWSDDFTSMQGEIFARGGKENGDGGFVEVSGLRQLQYTGHTDATAPQGKLGNLLLDPSNITIDTFAGNTGISFNAATGVYTPTALNAELALMGMEGLITELNTGAVNITVNTASAFGGDGDITINAPGVWTTANNLTLIADRDVLFLMTGELFNSSTGSIFITAGRDIAFSGTQTGLGFMGGNIELNAGRDLLMNASVNNRIFTEEGGMTLNVGNDFIIGSQTASTGAAFVGGGDLGLTLDVGRDFSIFGSDQPTAIKTVELGGVTMGPANSTINVGRNLTLLGGTAPGSQVILGGSSFNAFAGNMVLDVGGDVSITGGTEDNSFAIIGFLANTNDPGDRDITFDAVGGEITITSGAGDNSFAQIGHVNGNPSLMAGTTTGGDIILRNVLGSITLEADASTAMIGNGNLLTNGGDSYTGIITIESFGDIQVSASDTSPAGIGILLGGATANTAQSNEITIRGGSLTLLGQEQDAFIGYSDRYASAMNTVITGPITISTPGNITLQGEFIPAIMRNSAFIGVENGQSTTLSMIASNVNLSNATMIIDETISAIADKNIVVQNQSSATANNGNLIFVVDNQEPESPGIGDGRFILDATSSLVSGNFMRIFTAQRDLNIVEGTLNGILFVPGPTFIDTDSEQWGTYFPSDFGGDPFTIFYKTGLPRSIYNEIGRVIAEMFQNLKSYDRLLFEPKCFLLGYDKACYDQLFLPKGMMSSFDLFGDRATEILRRYYRNYHTLYVESF